MIAKIFYKQTLPFVTEIYNRNYPRERRGRIVGKLFTILAISGIIFAYFCGYLLDYSPLGYRWILYLTALSLFCCGYIFLQIPNGQVLLRDSESFFRSNLSILLNDRLFTLILALWSLTSIAFQMTFPLRVEYLANQGYGFNLSNGDITLIIVTIPTITRVASAFFWGKIFDMRHFAVMKVMIIICYLASIPLFFFTKNFTLLGVSAVALGLGYGGNLMAWQLWVLKIAPPERLGAYVSINVAVTGIRDAIAAALGYYLLSCAISLHTIAFSAVILTIISLIGFCFLLRHPRLK
jgi:MFS family permease